MTNDDKAVFLTTVLFGLFFVVAINLWAIERDKRLFQEYDRVTNIRG